MSTQKGQNNCPHCHAALAPKGAAPFSQPSPAQQALLEYVSPLDGPDRVKALKLVHDIVVYHSEEILDGEEKRALYQVKVLWDLIEDTFQKG
ncbi:hypothetical protein [Flagellimonas sp.]|uniref:hypothetical protein n=1 Tax=Flagellimonas sp. TaxID=2058762 RepID=UPI003BAFCEA3